VSILRALSSGLVVLLVKILLVERKIIAQPKVYVGSGWTDSAYPQPDPQKKIRPLPAHLPVGYPLKKYSRIFLKPTGTRGYSIPANILKIYILKIF